jgi:hypothetical protein
MDNPVIHFPVVAFQFGDIAITDENSLSKLNLGQFEGFSDLFDTLIDGHKVSIKEKNSLYKADIYKMSIDKNITL